MKNNYKRIYLLAVGIMACVFGNAQTLRYKNGNNGWNADSLGNHRFVVMLSQVNYSKNKTVARVVIPWRRRDEQPEKKRIIIADAKTGKRILNVKPGRIEKENGELFFEPVSGAGNYYVYYMPYKNEGRSNYPKGVYLKPDTTAVTGWLNKIDQQKNYAQAVASAYQSIDSLNSFYPMEFIATAKEAATIIMKNAPVTYLVFPESREYPIKMTKELPLRWIEKGAQKTFSSEAAKGEWLAFQLGIFALLKMDDVKISFTDLKSPQGKIIDAKNISCINTDGTDYKGQALHKTVNIEANTIQPMWCGIDIPATAAAGVYVGKAVIKSTSNPATEIQLRISVTNKTVSDGGISEPWKQTRLKWLNSTLAQDNTVIAPYTALKVEDSVISLSGRKVILNRDGFPAQVQTFFTPEMTSIGIKANNLFTEPLHFHFYDTAGKQTGQWKNYGLKFTQKEAGTVKWESVNTSESLQMDVAGTLEFDGFLSYTVRFTALQDISFKDINFHLPLQPEFSKYLMGLGLKGGNRPDSILWKWDVAHKNQDGAWIGNVNGGIQFSLRDEHYVRPLNTNFYLQKPLLLPASWGNDNKGGIDIFKKGKSILVNAYSGTRTVKKGDVLYYNFTLLITPFHPINTDFQWQTRFYHKYSDIDTIKSSGATVINIHHANAINPWINYPFIEWKKMKAYIDEAHSKGLKVKIYNTVRELSNHAYETFALRSLGHEIYSPGKGGGFSWLQEHVGNDYIAAWFVPEIKDAAIVNSGMSRWHNCYVEGMNWLTKNVGIDGIYLDDVAFDRITMKRIKRVLTQNGHPGIIDLHSANQYNKSDGFNNSANLYLEHFPYLNRLWFGEYFDYEKNQPDFFLTEVSGIPFGLMGEMLQDGGNPWRGMIYGMTNRMPWSDNADPRPIWKLWDEFGIQSSEMIGYWSNNCPVKTNNEKVLVSVYKKNGAALVAIASWADSDTIIKLDIDWTKLGIDPAKATITAQEVKNFQMAKTFSINDNIPVAKGKGWMLIIK